MVERVDRQVDVEIGPMEVLWADETDVGECSDGRVPKPWELLKRQKAFLASDVQPEAVRRYVRHFSGQSVLPTLGGSSIHEPGSASALPAASEVTDRDSAPARFWVPARTSPPHPRTVRGRGCALPRERRRKIDTVRLEGLLGSRPNRLVRTGITTAGNVRGVLSFVSATNWGPTNGLSTYFVGQTVYMGGH